MRPLRRRPSHDPDRERDEPPPREQGHAPVQDAAKADGKPITSYGATHLEEQYAESYSMFVSEPETMKLLRPKLFEFFTKYPGGAKP